MEAARHPWPVLGVLLMRDGLVSREDLESILDEQRDSRQQRISGRRLGEILIERGAATEVQISKLVAEQYELPFVDLEVSDIDLRVAALLSEDLARRYSALPISWRADGSLLLVIADPGTVVFSDELRRVLGASPHFAVVGHDAIEAAFNFVYTQNAPRPEAADVSDDSLVVDLRASPTDPQASAEAGDEPYFGAHRTAAHLWPPLGALLMREGLVSGAELERALAQQRLSANRRLGEILIDRGVVTRATVARLVAEQYELEYIELSEVDVDPAVASLLPEEVALRYHALPIGFLADDSVQVVVADPTNVLHTDELHRALGRPLSLAVAAPDAIEEAIDSMYNPELIHPSTPEPEAVVDDEPALDDEPEPSALEARAEGVEVDFMTPPEVPPELGGSPAVAVLPLEEPVAEPPAAEETSLEEVEENTELVVEDDVPHSFVDDLAEVLLAETTIADDFDETPEPAPDVFATEEPVAPAPTRPLFELVSWFEPARSVPVADVVIESGVEEIIEPEEVAVTGKTNGDIALEATPDPMPEDDVDEVTETEDVEAVAVTPGVPDITWAPGHPVDEGEIYAVVEPEDVETAEVAPVEEVIGATVDSVHEKDVDEVVPVDVDLDATIERALALGASSIHFSPQSGELVVRARIDGVLRELVRVPNADETSLSQSFASTDRMRVDVLPTVRGEKITLLVHESDGARATPSDLGLAADAEETARNALQEPAGVFLVCGPTRSGVTTTLYAALEALNTSDRVLMTIEDPVERMTDGVDQVQVDEGKGLTFARGLRSILRTDPDVLLVGELSDGETAEVAFQAAQAGHLVLSSVHAPTAAAAVVRLAEMGLDPERVGAMLTCVIAQRLVRRICADCRETYYATEAELAGLDLPSDDGKPRLLARGRGCPSCDHTGFRGRGGIFEVLPLTEEIRGLIVERASTKKIQRAAVSAGMRTLRSDGIRLCLEGVTTAAEVRRVVGTVD